MDSSESTIPSEGDATETVPVQDSPVFSYIGNLSPIQPVKEPAVSQGFTRLNSPPIVFTSPRLNPPSQSSLLKRSQFPLLSSAKLSGQDGGCRISIAAAERSEKLDTQLGRGLNTCLEKGFDSSRPVDDQTESPIGCADQFLADVVCIDSFNSNVSADSSLKYSYDIDQSPVEATNSKESAGKLEYKNDARGNEEYTAVAPSAITKQTDKTLERDATVDRRAIEIDMTAEDGDIQVDHCEKFGPHLSENLTLTNKHPENFMTENAEARQIVNMDDSSDLLSESVQIYEGNENSVETTGAFAEPVQKEEQSNPMAAQHSGLPVRCLQFEDAQQKVIANSHVDSPLGIENCSTPLSSSADREGPISLSLETPPSSISQAGMTQHMVYPRNRGNYSIKVPMPLGIGLHLNSIVSTMQIGAGETIIVRSSEKGNFSIRDEQQGTPVSSHLPDSSKNSTFLFVSESVLGSAHDSRLDDHASVAANSATSLSTYDAKPLDNPVVCNPIKDQSTPVNKRKYNTGNANDAEEFSKSSPKKKRKKTFESNDDYSCKRCNCKKSKCLKLYCDCFAAGIYCAEPCSCQGCFNRPEYEDTVLEIRQQIESRNPLAFAPKIVQNFNEPPSIICGEDETQLSKSTGRHKRGCNCKKSMCLKKYCECYQAKVGCSDGCRCEGCKNVHGQKGEYGMNTDVGMQGTDETDGSFVNKLEIVGSGNVLLHTELCNPHNLMPVTPSFQYSDHGKGTSKAWFPYGKYFQSPESGPTFGAPCIRFPRSPRSSDNPDMISETSKELDLVSFDHELEYHKAGAENDFSSGYHGHGNMELLAVPPNAQEWENNFKVQPSGQFSLESSLRWRGSPITPMAQFSGSKFPQAFDFYDDLHNVAEDDTPEILKDTPCPLNAVKVSSPNKKRVSPPHGHTCELGSSSSAGVRIARKFILQAVPSFPPLTPCVESKNSGQEKT